MKNEGRKIENNQKLFRWGDVFVYAFTLLIIFSLFLAFVILPSTQKSKGFKVMVDGKEVATYLYDGELSIKDASYKDLIVLGEDNTITIYLDQSKTHFNKIQVDQKQRTAKVIDANCSTSKDCTYTPALKGNSAIVCVPHKLKIVAIGKTEATPPVTGGVR